MLCWLQLSFEWTFTREGILALEVAELEGILGRKLEELALLRPFSAAEVSEGSPLVPIKLPQKLSMVLALSRHLC
jgi:hypothetical protein